MDNLLPSKAALQKIKGQAWAPRWWVVFLGGLALWGEGEEIRRARRGKAARHPFAAMTARAASTRPS